MFNTAQTALNGVCKQKFHEKGIKLNTLLGTYIVILSSVVVGIRGTKQEVWGSIPNQLSIFFSSFLSFFFVVVLFCFLLICLFVCLVLCIFFFLLASFHFFLLLLAFSICFARLCDWQISCSTVGMLCKRPPPISDHRRFWGVTALCLLYVDAT